MTGHAVPAVEVRLDATPLPATVRILLVRVSSRFGAPSQCAVSLYDPAGYRSWPAPAGPGARLCVRIAGADEPLFTGDVTGVELDRAPDGTTVARIRGYDVLYRLRRRQTLRALENVSVAAVARALAGDLDVEVDAGDGPALARVVQHRQTDFELLVEVAGRGGRLVVLDGRVLRLTTLDGYGDPVPLAFGSSLFSAGVEANVDRVAGHSCDRLDGLLLAPVADLLGDRPLVLAPTGALHALPWPMLPSCRGRPLSVTPSSWLWWRAASRAARPGAATVLVGGQAPVEAVAEVRAIAEVLAAGEPRGDTTVLTGPRAGVAAVLAAVDGTGCAHLATHGSFRADNPLFSHLRLADGPLTVYDLSGPHRPPALLILSACDSGLSAVHPGDELQGLSAAMLGLGTRAVVASLGPVRDEATRALMVDLHRHLSRGSAPAAALAAAQSALDPADASTAGSFVCLGAG